jgi:hypothetical protein
LSAFKGENKKTAERRALVAVLHWTGSNLESDPARLADTNARQ